MATDKHIRPIPIPTEKDLARFWKRVDKAQEWGGCWRWIGKPDRDGYGDFGIFREHRRAHRVAYVIATGKDPGELCVCHTCDNRWCVNPEHFFLGDNVTNTADRHRKGRSARGDRSGARLYPETRARGDRNGSRVHPEKLVRGEKHPCATITEALVLEMRRLYAAGVTKNELAAMFGIDLQIAYRAATRKTWKHLP